MPEVDRQRFVEVKDFASSSLAADCFEGVPLAQQMLGLYGQLIGASNYQLRFIVDQEQGSVKVESHKRVKIGNRDHDRLRAVLVSNTQEVRVVVGDTQAIAGPIVGDPIADSRLNLGMETGFHDLQGKPWMEKEGIAVPVARLSGPRNVFRDGPEFRLFLEIAGEFRREVDNQLGGRLTVVQPV